MCGRDVHLLGGIQQEIVEFEVTNRRVVDEFPVVLRKPRSMKPEMVAEHMRLGRFVSNRLRPCHVGDGGTPRKSAIVGFKSTWEPTARSALPGLKRRGFHKISGMLMLSW